MNRPTETDVLMMRQLAGGIKFDSVLEINLLRTLYNKILFHSSEPILTEVLEPLLEVLQTGNISKKQLAQLSALYGLKHACIIKIEENLEHIFPLIERVAASGSPVERASLIELFSDVIGNDLFQKSYTSVFLKNKQAIEALRIAEPQTIAEVLINRRLDNLFRVLA